MSIDRMTLQALTGDEMAAVLRFGEHTQAVREEAQERRKAEVGSIIELTERLLERLPKQPIIASFPQPIRCRVAPVPMTLANKAREEMGEARWNELNAEWVK